MFCPSNIVENCKKAKANNCPLMQNENDFCIKAFKVDMLKNNALLSENQKKYLVLKLDSEKTDKEAFVELKQIENNIEKFVEEGKNLYIFSHIVGNGKSSWSVRLLNTYLEKIWSKAELTCKGLFVSVPKFLIALKDNISQKSDYVWYIKENVLKANLVVWDDIGTKGFTQFEMENILNIIDNRLVNNKANIFTSNLNSLELKEAVGERLYSRIYNTSKIIEFKSADKRGII